MEQPKLKLRDFREPRDWRLWKEHAGFFIPECPCCGALVTIRKLYGLTTAGGTPPPPDPTTGGHEIWSEDTWQPIMDTAVDSAGNVIAISYGRWDYLYWADPPTNSILGHQVINDVSYLADYLVGLGKYPARTRFVLNGQPDTGSFKPSVYCTTNVNQEIGPFDTDVATGDIKTALEALSGFPSTHYKFTGSIKGGWTFEIDNGVSQYALLRNNNQPYGTPNWNVARAHPRAVSKWDPDGKLLWEHDFEGRDARCVVIDSNDNVIVGGNWLIKYDSAGNVLWSESPGENPAVLDTLGNVVSPAATIIVTDLAVDSNDNIFGTHQGLNTYTKQKMTVVRNVVGGGGQNAKQTVTLVGQNSGVAYMYFSGTTPTGTQVNGGYGGLQAFPYNATALQVENIINTGVFYPQPNFLSGHGATTHDYTGPYDPRGPNFEGAVWQARTPLPAVSCTGGPWPAPIVINWINNWANRLIGLTQVLAGHMPPEGNGGADSLNHWGAASLTKWDSGGAVIWRRGHGSGAYGGQVSGYGLGSVAVNAADEVIVTGGITTAIGYLNPLLADLGNDTTYYPTVLVGYAGNPKYYTRADGQHVGPVNCRKFSNDGAFLISRLVSGRARFQWWAYDGTGLNDQGYTDAYYMSGQEPQVNITQGGYATPVGLAIRGAGKLYVANTQYVKNVPMFMTSVAGSGVPGSTNQKFTLSYWGSDRDGIYGRVIGGTFTLNFDLYRGTGPIPYNADAATIQAAIVACLGVGTATVTNSGGNLLPGNSSHIMTVEFTGDYGLQNFGVNNFVVNSDNLIFDTEQGYHITTQAAPSNYYYRTIHPVHAPVGGTWTMTKQGITTSPIPWDATCEAIEAACNAVWPNANPTYPFVVRGGPLPGSIVQIGRRVQDDAHVNLPNLRLDLITIDNTQLYCSDNVLCLDPDTLDTIWGINIVDWLTSVAVDDHDRIVIGSEGRSRAMGYASGDGTGKTVYRFDPTGVELWSAHNGNHVVPVRSVCTIADGERVWTGTARSDKRAVDLFTL